jgi:murein DD-endopeptidase MepM/ murein hydrolase activator NlpD
MVFTGKSLVHRNKFRGLINRFAPCALAAGGVLVLGYAVHNSHTRAASPLERPAANAPSAPNALPTPTSVAPPATAARPAPRVAMQEASIASSIEIIVRRNDTLDAIFRRMALDKSDLAAIRELPGIRQSLDFLKPGDAIKLTHNDDGAIKTLTRKVSDTQTLEVVRQEDGFAAKLVSNPVETRIRNVAATIDSSLFQAAEAADMSDMVALKLANVFAWDIDFVLDIREGDRFTAVYEQIYQDGKYLRDGEVLAAEFVNNGKLYRAVRFVNDDGNAGYYTPEGQPMRKAFLRAPVEFSRISSGFNPHRLHPILNTIRGHMGTDYAAPTGTPVHAAGDGHVSFAGQRGGYGNALIIAHSNSVSTLYGHLSRFAAHLRVGAHVQQGDVIGYVGMTGLATGPHLHYEYLMNGVHKDPQTVHLPGAEPLHAEALQTFRSQTAPLLADLVPATGHLAGRAPVASKSSVN